MNDAVCRGWGAEDFRMRELGGVVKWVGVGHDIPIT